MRLFLLPGLLLAASTAAAQSPDDFAWQWPLGVDANEGAHTLLLDEAVYARTTRADLRDLAVFNADGQLVPFAPLPVEHATTEQRRELRWLRLPAALTAVEQLGKGRAGEGIVLHLDPLAGGNVDHRGLQLRGQVGEACRSAFDRYDPVHHRIVVLRHLRAERRARDQRDGSAAHQQRARQSVYIAHFVHVLMVLILGRNAQGCCTVPQSRCRGRPHGPVSRPKCPVPG